MEMSDSFITEKLFFPQAFLEDEVRDGFFVSEMMKRYWAGHLTVLSAIDKICQKHDIPWFADYGTLLGAVRHQGFIPWDDDVDIIMLRHDLQRFLEIAPSALPEGMEVVDIQTQDDTDNTVAAVVSDPSRADHMEQFHGCPYRCCVDIMALDGCYDSDADEAAHRERFREVFETASYFVRHDEPLRNGVYTEAELYPKEAAAALHRAEKTSGMKAEPGKDRLVQVLRMLVKVAREVPDTEAKTLDRFFAPRGTRRYQKKWYLESVRIPFEHMMIPVPVPYEEVVAFMYGDWRKIIRGGADHDYPSYREQETYLKQRTGGNPFRYTFSKEDLLAGRGPSVAERIAQMQPVLEQVSAKAETLIAAGETAAASQLLASAEKLLTQMDHLTGAAERTRKEVVFFPVRGTWWNTMDTAYRKAVAQPDTDVCVVPLPWYERNADGSLGRKHDDHDGYPADVTLTSVGAYDVTKRFPDEVYIQFPFDGTNRSVAIDPAYHAKTLRAFTGKLVYIPCYDVTTPDENDAVSRIALETLIEQPAVVFADEVWLADEGMRNLYLEWLCASGGEDVRDVCERKLHIATKTL